MGLIIQLRSGERVFLGNTILINRDKDRSDIEIEGDTPIMREKDFLPPDQATTPCKRLYLTIQRMYLENAASALHFSFTALHNEIESLLPTAKPILQNILSELASGAYYRALKEGQKLIQLEAGGLPVKSPPAVGSR